MYVLPVTSGYQIQSTVYSSAGMVNILYASVKWNMKWISIAYKHIVSAATFQITTIIIAGQNQQRHRNPLATVV